MRVQKELEGKKNERKIELKGKRMSGEKNERRIE